jgi:hypothetical protein
VIHGGVADFTLFAGALGLALLLAQRQGLLHPATLFACFWTVTFAVRITAPMKQAAFSMTAAVVLGVGILAVCVPAVLGARTPGPLQEVRLGDRDVARERLIVLTCVVGAVVLIALHIFRSYITGYYFGADLAQLSSSAIRAAQLAGTRGGPLTLGLALSPLLGALGVYGALRYSRWWLLVTAFALFVTLQYPARITTLGLAVSCATFSAYARPLVARDPQAPAARGRPSTPVTVAQLLVVASAALAYFIYTGAQLKKDVVASFFVQDWTWPQWLLSPVQYVVGGLSGMAAAIGSPIGDPYGADGHPVTTYLPILLSGEHPKDTIAGYTLAPFPVNVYTAFGDLYFDWGITGVIGLSLLLGLAAQIAYRLHHRRLELTWVAAMLVNVLLSTGMAYRLFYLDVAVATAGGWLAFFWLARSAPAPARPERVFPWSGTSAPGSEPAVDAPSPAEPSTPLSPPPTSPPAPPASTAPTAGMENGPEDRP